MLRPGYGNKEGKGMLRAGYGSKKKLIPLHSLTSFEIQKYYQNVPRFNGVYSRDNLVKTIFILIVLQLNMFLKKLKILLEIKTSKQTYFE